jgi:hypothetical protein
MKTAFVVVLFIASALAQDPGAITAAQSACGAKGTSFDVKPEATPHAVVQPEAGKALIYVIEDARSLHDEGYTVRIGMDGTWAGANRGSSYFSFSLEPGEHHLCANWQSHFARLSRLVSLAHLSAEAGKVYYFQTSFEFDSLDLIPIDSDQGRLLIASYPLSISTLRK